MMRVRFCLAVFGAALFLSACRDGGTGQAEVERETGAERIVMTLQTIDSSRMEDLDEVIAAVNAISIPEIGVEVEIRLTDAVDAVDAYTQYPLWISRGEQVDLMMLNYQDITSYTSKGMLLPLDALLAEQAPAITDLMETEGYRLTEGSIVDGRAYGVVVVNDNSASGGGIWVPERYIRAAGFDYDERHIYTLDELTQWFKRWKELYPDKYPLGQITSGNTYSTINYYGRTLDGLGGDVVTGVVLTQDGTEVVNLFATDLYLDFLQHMREWYLAGYIYPDAAITDAGIGELAGSGIVMSYPRSSQPSMGIEQYFGEKVVCMRTSEVRETGQYAKSGFWTVPVTSGCPEAAMRFLNLMYENAEVANLIQWGLEGKHYEILDAGRGIIGYPAGLDASTVWYYNPLALYGDTRRLYFMGNSMGTSEQLEKQRAYQEEALPNENRTRGFVYQTSSVNKEIDALSKVVERYVPILESGSVDLDIYYPRFLQELEQAGIDKVIADKQAQVDAWLVLEK